MADAHTVLRSSSSQTFEVALERFEMLCECMAEHHSRHMSKSLRVILLGFFKRNAPRKLGQVPTHLRRDVGLSEKFSPRNWYNYLK